MLFYIVLYYFILFYIVLAGRQCAWVPSTPPAVGLWGRVMGPWGCSHLEASWANPRVGLAFGGLTGHDAAHQRSSVKDRGLEPWLPHGQPR